MKFWSGFFFCFVNESYVLWCTSAAMSLCLDLFTIAHSRGPFYQHGLTLIPAWISNYIYYKVWDEITYPFLTCNRWRLGIDK